MKDRFLNILNMYPKGVKLSLAGLIMLFLTGSSLYMIIKFPFYTRFKVIFVLFFVINTLLFIRFREPRNNLIQKMMQSKFFPRKLTFTMEGKYLVFITLGIGFAAVNTGINLLYLLMAMLLSMIVASGILSELTLKRLRWEVDLPSEATVSSETLAILAIRNGKRRLSSFSLEGELLIPENKGIVQKKGTLLKLNAGKEGQILVRLIFSQRGKQEIRGVSIETRFPFSFFTKSRHYEFNRSVLVLPKGEEPVAQTLSRLTIKQLEDFETMDNRGQGLEFHSVRQMYSGDDWRSVHWKKTAAGQGFVIREFDSLAGRRATVCLTGNRGSQIVYQQREKGIELAASIAKFLVYRDFQVGLLGPNLCIEEGGGPSSLKRIFVALALLDAGQEFQKIGSQKNRNLPETCIWINLDSLNVSQTGGVAKGESVI